MLANRVSMGPTIQPPRFRWVPYADALIFPLDNSKLAAVNSDRKSFFALEDKLRARYLQDAGLTAPPATLAEYLSRVVTPTLEKQRQGGAVAEKFEAAYLRSLAFDKVDRATRRAYLCQCQRLTPTISRCRIFYSAISPPNAGAWEWPCISTPRPARGVTST